MDIYFHEINNIINKKETSTRIYFALKDIVELRYNNWIPRREDEKPKKIDQIHKEALQSSYSCDAR